MDYFAGPGFVGKFRNYTMLLQEKTFHIPDIWIFNVMFVVINKIMYN